MGWAGRRNGMGWDSKRKREGDMYSYDLPNSTNGQEEMGMDGVHLES